MIISMGGCQGKWQSPMIFLCLVFCCPRSRRSNVTETFPLPDYWKWEGAIRGEP